MSRAPLRLALVVPSLTSGGAERVVQTLSGAFVERGHFTTVITTTSREDFYQLSSGVQRIRCDLTGQVPGEGLSASRLPGTIAQFPRGLSSLRDAISSTDADVVIGFLEHANLASVLTSSDRPVIVTEHTDPTHFELGRSARLARRALYPRAAALVSVSEGVDRSFAWLDESRRHVIHNPVPMGDVAPGREVRKSVVAVGRLTREKGFDLLLEAFARLGPSRRDWTLTILGEGPERASLEAQVAHHGLGDRVSMPGLVHDVQSVMSDAAMLALSSRFEGFGNVLVESLAVGTPVIAFDCPVGPREIVNHGNNGLLVDPESPQALAAGLERLMGDEELRARLSLQAPESVARFSVDRVVDRWEMLFEEFCEDRDEARQAA